MLNCTDSEEAVNAIMWLRKAHAFFKFDTGIKTQLYTNDVIFNVDNSAIIDYVRKGGFIAVIIRQF